MKEIRSSRRSYIFYELLKHYSNKKYGNIFTSGLMRDIQERDNIIHYLKHDMNNDEFKRLVNDTFTEHIELVD